jgi:PAS domain S-box-containing protein
MRKIFYIIIVITTFFFLGTGIILFQQEKNLLLETSRENARNELKILGGMAQLDMLSNDYSQVEENLLNWVELEENLIFTEVALDSGFTIAQYGQKGQHPNYFTVTETVPLFDGGNLIYTVDFSTEFIEEHANSLFLKILTYGAIITILLVISLWLLIYKVAVVPLNRLMDGAQKIGQGDLDLSIKIESKDEFGRLASEFNLMATRLHGLIDELRRFEHIVSSSKDMIALLDKNYVYLAVNNAYKNGFGMTRDEIVGHSVSEVFGQEFFEEVIKPNAKRCLAGDEVTYSDWFEFPVYGSLYMEIIYTQYIGPDKEVKGFVVNGRDITEKKKAEEAREELNRELSQIVYITSHDLRSPLVNINGYCKELEYSMKKLENLFDSKDMPLRIKEKIAPVMEENIPESLHYISHSISKMEALLAGMLTLSRSGRAELIIEDIDMNEIVSDVINNLKSRLNETGIKTEVGKLPSCRGDKNQLNQVFANITGNAVKYIDPDRAGIVKISGYTKGLKSVYCVEDNGIGIAPEYQEKIFEIFHQLDPQKAEGDGLGLSIVHKILNRLGGEVWVESESGRGSKFFVSLPAK